MPFPPPNPPFSVLETAKKEFSFMILAPSDINSRDFLKLLKFLSTFSTPPTQPLQFRQRDVFPPPGLSLLRSLPLLSLLTWKRSFFTCFFFYSVPQSLLVSRPPCTSLCPLVFPRRTLFESQACYPIRPFDVSGVVLDCSSVPFLCSLREFLPFYSKSPAGFLFGDGVTLPQKLAGEPLNDIRLLLPRLI